MKAPRSFFKQRDLATGADIARVEIHPSFQDMVGIQVSVGVSAHLSLVGAVGAHRCLLTDELGLSFAYKLAEVVALPEDKAVLHRMVLDGSTFVGGVHRSSGSWTTSRHEQLRKAERLTELVALLGAFALSALADRDERLHSDLRTYLDRHFVLDPEDEA